MMIAMAEPTDQRYGNACTLCRWQRLQVKAVAIAVPTEGQWSVLDLWQLFRDSGARRAQLHAECIADSIASRKEPNKAHLVPVLANLPFPRQMVVLGAFR